MNIYLTRLCSICVFITVLFCIYNYPVVQLELALFLISYLVLLIYFPQAWLIVIPLCLPILDFAPYTGRFFFDEFDFLILTTFSHFLWTKKGGGASYSLGFNLFIIYIFFIFYLVSFFIGLLPWQTIDVNSFSNYYSSFNSVRVAKGGVIAFLLLPLLRRDCADTKGKVTLSYGLILGFALVCLSSIWERFIFSGLFDYTSDFRITSWFSSMHTGGGHIDSYLILVFPFLFVIFEYKKSLKFKILAVILFILGVYVLLVTFSRGVYIGFFIEFFMLFILLYLHYHPKLLSKITIQVFGFITIVLVITFFVFKGEFIHKRIANINNDYDVRVFHWQDAISMMDNGFTTTLFGMGLGSYPRTYYLLNSENVTPANYFIVQEGQQNFLRLMDGDPLYLGQYINVQSHKQYILKYDQRANGDAQLSIPVCEKSLLYSFECNWLIDLKKKSSNEWQHIEIIFDMGKVGESHKGISLSRPVQIALTYGMGQGFLDVDNIELIDGFGRNVISNGSFGKGLDRWFFSTENHMPWHIKNLWVHIFFDQGALGLMLFCCLVVVAFVNLKSRIMKADYFAYVLMSSMSGFFVVSIVASPFDAPRLTVLFFIILFLSLENKKGVSNNFNLVDNDLHSE